MDKQFEGVVAMDERFEIMAPGRFSMVCFSPLAMHKKLKIVD